MVSRILWQCGYLLGFYNTEIYIANFYVLKINIPLVFIPNDETRCYSYLDLSVTWELLRITEIYYSLSIYVNV